MSTPSRHLPIWLPDLLLLLVAIVWGTSYRLAKQSVAFYSVLGFLAIRFCLTFLLLIPALRQLGCAADRNALRAGLPLGLILLTIFVAETFGVMLTQASNAAFLISLCVVLTPFAEWMLLSRRPETRAFPRGALSVLRHPARRGVMLDLTLGGWVVLMSAVLRALIVAMDNKLATEKKTMSTLVLPTVQNRVAGLGTLLLVLLEFPSGFPFLS